MQVPGAQFLSIDHLILALETRISRLNGVHDSPKHGRLKLLVVFQRIHNNLAIEAA